MRAVTRLRARSRGLRAFLVGALRLAGSQHADHAESSGSTGIGDGVHIRSRDGCRVFVGLRRRQRRGDGRHRRRRRAARRNGVDGRLSQRTQTSRGTAARSRRFARSNQQQRITAVSLRRKGEGFDGWEGNEGRRCYIITYHLTQRSIHPPSH